MSEIELGTREGIAAQFTASVGDICPQARNAEMPQGELVRSVVKYVGASMVEGWGSEDAIDMPRAWRFAVPAQGKRTGVVPVEFGVTVKDLTGGNHDEARFMHELAINQDLQLNLRKNPAVAELFSLIGGDLAKRVYDANDDFFAVIERRYRLRVEPGQEGQYANWSHLAYSPELLKTGTILQKFVTDRRLRGRASPDWMHRLTQPRNRYFAAQSMVLSALLAVSNEAHHR